MLSTFQQTLSPDFRRSGNNTGLGSVRISTDIISGNKSIVKNLYSLSPATQFDLKEKLKSRKDGSPQTRTVYKNINDAKTIIDGPMPAGNTSPVMGVSPRKASILLNGEVLAEEIPFEHVKGVGRKHNIFDNMNRTFKIKGHGNAKMDMWNLLALLDAKKKKEEDDK